MGDIGWVERWARLSPLHFPSLFSYFPFHCPKRDRFDFYAMHSRNRDIFDYFARHAMINSHNSSVTGF